MKTTSQSLLGTHLNARMSSIGAETEGLSNCGNDEGGGKCLVSAASHRNIPSRIQRVDRKMKNSLMRLGLEIKPKHMISLNQGD